jgi:hypothetical protein
VVNARIMNWLIPRSRLHIYHGGHLELAANPERLAVTVEAFLDTDVTPAGVSHDAGDERAPRGIPRD